MSFIYNAGTSGIYNESDEFMAGQIAFSASGVIPAGWLECNGAAISRATYGTLFAAIGTNYGAGDGATTFNLPDLRGEFIRGADRARGVDPGRTIGSSQGDAIREISGVLGASIGNDQATGPFAVDVLNPAKGKADSSGEYVYPTRSFKASRVVPVAAENRPRNVALVPIIKFS